MSNCKISRVVYKNKNVIKVTCAGNLSGHYDKWNISKEILIKNISELKLVYEQSINYPKCIVDSGYYWLVNIKEVTEPIKSGFLEIDETEYAGFKIGDIYKKNGIQYKIIDLCYDADDKNWKIVVDHEDSKNNIETEIDSEVSELVDKFNYEYNKLREECIKINKNIKDEHVNKQECKIEKKPWWKFGRER